MSEPMDNLGRGTEKKENKYTEELHRIALHCDVLRCLRGQSHLTRMFSSGNSVVLLLTNQYACSLKLTSIMCSRFSVFAYYITNKTLPGYESARRFRIMFLPSILIRAALACSAHLSCIGGKDKPVRKTGFIGSLSNQVVP